MVLIYLGEQLHSFLIQKFASTLTDIGLDENESASETEGLQDVCLSSQDNKTISISPSEAAPASGNSPAAEKALVSGKVQALGSNPLTKESASKMGEVVSPTNTTEEKPSPSDGAPSDHSSSVSLTLICCLRF